MVMCSAYGCKSHSSKKVPGISFHRFPLKNVERMNIWLKNMKVKDWTPSKNDRLCSIHFKKTMFYTIGEKTCLLDEAVPEIFTELPKYLQPTETKRGLNEKRYNSWMRAIGRDPLDKLSYDNVICSEHFPSEDIILAGKRVQLKKSSLPCLKLKGSDFVKHPGRQEFFSKKRYLDRKKLCHLFAPVEVIFSDKPEIRIIYKQYGIQSKSKGEHEAETSSHRIPISTGFLHLQQDPLATSSTNEQQESLIKMEESSISQDYSVSSSRDDYQETWIKIEEASLSQEPSTSCSINDHQEFLLKIEEPSTSQEHFTSSSTNDWQETSIKAEEPTIGFVNDAGYIKSEPLDSLSESEEPVNVSFKRRSASNIGKMYCRLCLMPTYEFATPIGAVDSHYSESPAFRKKKLEEIQDIQKMIAICLPFYKPLTLNPVTCSTCLTQLKNSYNFAVKCLEKQKEIQEYINISGTSEKVNINDVIESKFLTSKVQIASHKKADITVPNESDPPLKKNKNKRSLCNKGDVDAPIAKKQNCYGTSRAVIQRVKSDTDTQISVEHETDNSDEATPIGKPTSINSKDKEKDMKTKLNCKDSLDLIKTEFVCEFENDEIDIRMRRRSHIHSQEENDPLELENVTPNCR